MSEVCCDLCAYWLPQFKECGNTHINKCINKEHFVKVERNCGTCEREIEAKAVDEFAEKIIEKYHELPTTLAYTEEIVRGIAEQMKASVENEN